MLILDSKHNKFSFLLTSLREKAKYQYNLTNEAANSIFTDDCVLKLSKKTKRIREIERNGKLIFMLRPNNGFLVAQVEGARLLLKYSPSPNNRVVIYTDYSEMVAEGRNLFAKHVKNLDSRIKTGSEVIVVNEDDELIAVGKSLLNHKEMLDLNYGIGVKVRRGVKK